MEETLFTNSVQNLINQSAALANQYGHGSLRPIHTLGACLDNDFCVSFFNVFDMPVAKLRQLVADELESLPQNYRGQLAVDNSLNAFLRDCKNEAESLGDQYVSLEHLFLQWLFTDHLPESIRSFFSAYGLQKKDILKYMDYLRGGKKADSKDAEHRYQMLEKYCKNITQMAIAGKA